MSWASVGNVGVGIHMVTLDCTCVGGVAAVASSLSPLLAPAACEHQHVSAMFPTYNCSNVWLAVCIAAAIAIAIAITTMCWITS